MTDKRVRAVNANRKPIAGKVILVYTDALASGINEYIPVTYLLVEDDKGIVHSVHPRDVLETVSEKLKSSNLN